MGQTESKNPIWVSTFHDLPLSEENIAHIRTIKDPLLGDIDEIQHKTAGDETFLRKEVLLNDNSRLTSEALVKLKARVHLKNDNLLRIYGFMLDLSKQESSKLDLYFESFSSDASFEFGSRQKVQTFFDEEELYGSFITMAEALGFLQRHKISHGHISPQAILMSKYGEIKLLDHTLLLSENSAFLACKQGEQIPYIAPELVGHLRDNTPVPSDFNQYKADMFSLGMTFLYGALLEEPHQCYDWQAHTFQEPVLTKKLQQVLLKYPGRFGNILSHILETDPDQRPDPITLFTRLSYFQSTLKIDGKEVFQSVDRAEMNKQYSFVDPRVQEIIREAKEKNWIKSVVNTNATLSSSPNYHNQHNSDSKSLHESHLKDQTPFADRYRDFLSRSRLVEAMSSPDNGLDQISTSKLIFNRPEVNEIIENVLNLKASTHGFKDSYTSLLKSQYFETGIKKHIIGFEKSNGFNHDLGSFESPVKKTYQQLVRESDGYSWGSGTKSPNETITVVHTNQYQKKTQSKEEIIRELKNKYGSQKNNLEGKDSEEKGSEEKVEKISEIQESKTVKQK